MLRELTVSVSGAGKRSLSRPVIAALERYDWPGTVRELRNALERALILSRGAPIELAHLPAEMRGGARSGDESLLLADAEMAHIRRVLERAIGNRTKAAELLGISRSTLKRRLNEPD